MAHCSTRPTTAPGPPARGGGLSITSHRESGMKSSKNTYPTVLEILCTALCTLQLYSCTRSTSSRDTHTRYYTHCRTVLFIAQLSVYLHETDAGCRINSAQRRRAGYKRMPWAGAARVQDENWFQSTLWWGRPSPIGLKHSTIGCIIDVSGFP